MKLWRWLKQFRTSPPPVIMSEWGQVTEAARLRAALNMAEDAEVKRRVEEALVRKYGVARGLAEARRRYREAYTKEK